VVNLWATWCGPCRAEMPVLAQAQADYPGVRLVFVNQGEALRTVDDYLASHDLHITNSLLDPTHAVAAAVGAVGFPTTLFYDAHGRLLAAHLGPFSRATFRQAVAKFYPADISKTPS
jgi:thiol-disulfide isomerase/thioredoxin